MDCKLYHGDCLELLPDLSDESVDMILCDLPYGVTACSWDKVIPIQPLWEQYKRVIKPTGAICLFANMRFGLQLINANPGWYRYEWIWRKSKGTNFPQANVMPMRVHEFIFVFYKHKPTYNPQFWYSTPYSYKGGTRSNHHATARPGSSCGEYAVENNHPDGRRYPHSVLEFKKQYTGHSSQKPVELLEYLIRTYTNENELVLDNAMGSGSTGVASLKTNRRFIGMELNSEFYQTAKQRIEEQEYSEVAQ